MMKFLCVFFALFCATAQAQTIKVMTSSDLSPLAIGANASPRGFHHDLLDELAARSGLTIEVIYQPWERAQKTALKDGDRYVAAMGQTDARLPKYDWIVPMITVRQAFLSRTEAVDSIDAAADLGLVVARSVYYDKLVAQGLTNAMAVQVESGLRMLEAGRADAMLMPAERGIYEWRAMGFSSRDLIIGETISETDLWLAGPKDGDPEIAQRLKDAMAAVKADGFYDRLYDSYFAIDN